MNKVFYLKTCGTCSRILKELKVSEFDIELREIKSQPITIAELEEMHGFTNSYEALFSKRAQKYKLLGLKDKNLQESDFKQFILEEYTFLQRPVFIIENEIFIGNSKKTVEEVKEKLNSIS